MASRRKASRRKASRDYHFVTTWKVTSTVEEIDAILSDATGLTRWWPSVYLDVKELQPGDENGIGKVVALYTKGWLPYTLRWQFQVSEVNHPYGFALQATGDFVGRGIWSFRQDGPDVEVSYDWKVRADKPLLRKFSFLLKPVFSANHRWAMKMGEKSLRLELARRRARTPEELALIPPPPGPTSAYPFLAGAAGLLGLAALLVRRTGNNSSRA